MLFRQMLREHLFLVLGYQLLLLVNIAAAIAYWRNIDRSIGDRVDVAVADRRVGRS